MPPQYRDQVDATTTFVSPTPICSLLGWVDLGVEINFFGNFAQLWNEPVTAWSAAKRASRLDNTAPGQQ